jgi:chromosome partitioning protein
MKTVAVLSQKGGSGKTTIAVHLAVCAAEQKKKVALIDTDPQASAWQWNESRDEVRKLDAIRAEANQVAGYLERAKAGGIDLVIIDTAPHSNHSAAIVAALADLILIPCRPARFDMAAVPSTVQIAAMAKKPFLAIMNAAPRGRLAQEAAETLEERKIPVLKMVLHNRAAYSHAVIDGRAVHEYEPDGKAAEEVDELYYHISRILGISKGKRKTHDEGLHGQTSEA